MEEEEIYDGGFSDLEDEDGFDGGENEISDLEGEEGEFDDLEEDETIMNPLGEKKEVVIENVEITEKFFEKLRDRLEKNPGFGSIKMFLQIFVDLLNEENTQTKRKRAYLVTDLNLMNSIIRYGVEVFPAIVIKFAEYRYSSYYKQDKQKQDSK